MVPTKNTLRVDIKQSLAPEVEGQHLHLSL
eukprot:COSAG05_NODE_1556_length_4568_cov_2.886776_1_plen_29_part_10